MKNDCWNCKYDIHHNGGRTICNHPRYNTAGFWDSVKELADGTPTCWTKLEVKTE